MTIGLGGKDGKKKKEAPCLYGSITITSIVATVLLGLKGQALQKVQTDQGDSDPSPQWT